MTLNLSGSRTRPFTPQHTSTLPEFNVGSEENVTQSEHWVSRLFPPTYREDLAADEEDMKTVLGNRLTAIDPDALRKVFHRVHALLAEQKEVVEGKRTTTTVAEPVVPVPPAPQPGPQADDSCIWDEAEISVLRQTYKSTRDENRKLKTHLKFAEQRLASLDNKYTKLQRDHDLKTKSLSEAEQANSRLHILSQTLKHDLDSTTKQNKDLQSQLQSLKLERLDFIDKLKEARIESDHDRIEKKRLELTVRENGKTLIETASHLESKLRVKYEREANELRKKMEEVEEELVEEKRLHEATRRGLDHLRTHFASMPLENAVTGDSLTNVKAY